MKGGTSRSPLGWLRVSNRRPSFIQFFDQSVGVPEGNSGELVTFVPAGVSYGVEVRSATGNQTTQYGGGDPFPAIFVLLKVQISFKILLLYGFS